MIREDTKIGSKIVYNQKNINFLWNKERIKLLEHDKIYIVRKLSNFYGVIRVYVVGIKGSFSGHLFDNIKTLWIEEYKDGV